MCVTEKGFCGSSLQKTCLYIGALYLLINIILLITSIYMLNLAMATSPEAMPHFKTVDVIQLILDIVPIVCFICLFLAAKNENKYLIIPFYAEYGLTILVFILEVIELIEKVNMYGMNQFRDIRSGAGSIISEDEKQNPLRSLDMFDFSDYLIRFVIETFAIRYAISYYAELHSGIRNTRRSERHSTSSYSRRRRSSGRRRSSR